MTKKTTNNNQKEAKAPYIDAKITSMGFIVPVYKCPDCRTPLKFDDDDDSDICYCYKCGCKVKIESEDDEIESEDDE